MQWSSNKSDPINTLFGEKTGNRSDDYYYTFDKNGRKKYYSIITKKVISKKNIPKELIDNIKVRDINTDPSKLIISRDDHLKKIENLQAKLKDLQSKVDAINILISQPNITSEEECKKRQQEEEERRKQYKKEQAEELRKLFERMKQHAHSYESKPTPKVDPIQQTKILRELHITTKKEWKEWLLKNHPDKGGSDDICSKVIVAGRAMGW